MISMKSVVHILYAVCLGVVFSSSARRRPDERDYSVSQRFAFALKERPFAAVLFYDNRSKEVEDRFNRINVDRYAGHVAFIRVNVSSGAQQKMLANRYLIAEIPSIVLFSRQAVMRNSDGTPAILAGDQSLYDIEAFVAQHLGDPVDDLRQHQADPDVAYHAYQQSQDRRNWQKYPPYYYRDPYFNWTYPYYRGYYGGYTTLGLGVSL